MTRDEQYVKAHLAWQGVQKGTLEMIKNNIGWSERDIDISQRRLVLEREQLQYYQEAYDAGMKEYNDYMANNDAADPNSKPDQ